MSEIAISALRTIIQENALCDRIVRFLMEHEDAMDNARGIAACWVDSDELSVHSALEALIGCGVVTAYTLGSGTLYGLNRNPEARAWFRTTFSGDSQRLMLSPGTDEAAR